MHAPSPPCSRCATAPAGAALATRARPVRGRLGAPRRSPAARRDARGVDPPAPRGEGRPPRGRAPRAGRDVQRPRRETARWEIATAYLGLVPLGLDPASRRTRAGIRSTSCRDRIRPRGDRPLGRDRLRGKLSYSNIGFALAPATFTLTELRDVYAAALGYDVSATNLKRVLLRRGAIEPTGGRRARAAPADDRRRSSASREHARDHRSVRSAPPAAPLSAFVGEPPALRRARRRPPAGRPTPPTRRPPRDLVCARRAARGSTPPRARAAHGRSPSLRLRARRTR